MPPLRFAAVFLTFKQTQADRIQQVLNVTEIQGAANQSQSKANASIARAAEKLRNRPSDPNDEIRKRVRVLNADPNAELIDSGPLYWGIIDTDDTVAMGYLAAENYQYAKKQIDKALDIEREPVMQFLLSGDSWQKCQSISKAANLLTCGGLRKLWAELDGDKALLKDLFASKDAAYLKRCFEDMALYLDQYTGRPVRTERSFDCHAVITLAKAPGRNLAPAMSYGELISVADQREKHLRTNDEKRFGKKVDFMYHNSGAETRQHLRHAKENVIHLAKCARSLSMALKKRVPDCREVIVPFFQILDLKARFYLQFEAADEIYIMHQYQDVSFPQDDGDVLGMLELVEAFLTMRCAGHDEDKDQADGTPPDHASAASATGRRHDTADQGRGREENIDGKEGESKGERQQCVRGPGSRPSVIALRPGLRAGGRSAAYFG
ncbi:hypothetical protein HDU90_001568 [Geranomyces variabilis]|nr:hypothetical protein HDU90_001568 [Geranomyces variabilis]